MLNIDNQARAKEMQKFGLYQSGKSCYVMARFCLEVSVFDFLVPGFLLMQQSLENLIKACLETKNISWISKNGRHGNNSHKLTRLINLGKNISFFQNKIINRKDFLNLLEELQNGYNSQRYGESGHFITNHENMMDLFDEIVFIFIEEFAALINRNNDEKLKALPLPVFMEKTFNRKKKQKFIVIDNAF